MTLQYDISINQGESWSVVFPVVDVNGNPVTVTGWSAKAQVRESELSPVLYEWSNTFSNITVGVTTITLTVPAAASTTWQWSNGLYDVELTDTANRVYRIAEGRVHVSPEITH